MSAPSIPQFVAYIENIFSSIISSLQAAKAKAEAALPGSGAFFDAEINKVIAARAAADPAAAVLLLLSELGGLVAGTAPIVHKRSDLAR